MNPPQIQMTPSVHGEARSVRAFLLVAASLGGVFLLGLLARLFLENGLSWRCPSVVLFNVPCPSCGTTRALAALADFRVLDALRLNPLLVLAVAFLLAVPLLKVSLKVSLESFERSCHAAGGWLVLAAAILANWIYLLIFLPR